MKKFFKWLWSPFSGGQPENKLRILEPTVKRTSKRDQKYYRVDVIIECNGHRLGVFPLTVVAHDKAEVNRMIIHKTALIPTNIHLDKSYARSIEKKQ